MNTTNKIKSITIYRKVMLDGVGEEESLVATGGAADHLAVVYNTDDQVTFFMMIMAWCDDGHWGAGALLFTLLLFMQHDQVK